MKKLKELFSKITASVKRKPLIWAVSFVGAAAVFALFLPYLLSDNADGTSDTQEIQNATEDAESDNKNNDNYIGELNYLSRVLPESDCAVTSVEAEKTTGLTAAPDTAFLITTMRDMSAGELKTMLALEPDVPFEIMKTGDCNFTLKCTDALPNGCLVRINALGGNGETERRWAFQTTDIFKITSTLPSDEGKYVPFNTGIEITFSSAVNPSDMPGYFNIEPDIPGHFERNMNTIVFVPDKYLNDDTVYTVTVSPGLNSADGVSLEEGRVFKFKTEIDYDNYNYFYTSGGFSETFLPGDPVIIEIFSPLALSLNSEVETVLYQYKDSSAYQNALNEYIGGASWERDAVLPVSGLISVYSSNEKLTRADKEAEWRPSFIMLPDNLEEGWYLADIKTTYRDKEYRAQKLIQINPVSVYSSYLPNEAMFFINDTGSGKAASGANGTLSLTGKTEASFSADADGVARAKFSDENGGRGVIRIDYNGHIYLDLFDLRGYSERTLTEDFYTHIYTDREAYRTTDEINVWGVVIPRGKDVVPPPDMYLRLGYDGSENAPVPVILKADGTFTATVKIERHTEQQNYFLYLMTGDDYMSAKSVIIRDYIKPSYVFDTNVPFCAWLPQTNPLNLEIDVSFFEGTPARDVNVRFESWNSPEPQQIESVTDENGHAEASVLINDEDTWYPRYYNTYFSLSGIENEPQRKEVGFYGIHRDVMLEYGYENGVMSVKTSMVDPSGFKPEKQNKNMSYQIYNYGSSYYKYGYDNSYYNYDYAEILRGKPVDVTVTGTLYRTYYAATEIGSYYDFIQKQNVKTYNYEYREEVIDTYSIDTKGGAGEFTGLSLDIPDSYYYMELVWKDTGGRTVAERAYINTNPYSVWLDNSIHHYNLVPDSYTFTEGQSIHFRLTDNSEDAAQNADGRIFLAVSGSEFIDTRIVNQVSFSHKMTDAYIPNVYISGAYFDGRHVFVIPAGDYTFDSNERRLDIAIAADKKKYSPGESAAVTVTVRDKNGRPVPGASVSLSAVDEAAFAVAEQNFNTRESLYAHIVVPYVSSYCSYIEHSLTPNGGSEKGGGGGENTPVRRDFKDMAAFLTGKTDADGSVTFGFKLPDNLTSWRLTAQAVGNDAGGALCAGNSKTPLTVTQPFFLTTVSLPVYTAGDDVAVSARCNGAESKDTLITAVIKGGGGFEKTATAKSDEVLSFGKLPIGTYTILFSAKEGENADAVERPIEVADSLLEMPIARDFNLATGAKNLNPIRYPVTLAFYDNQYSLYADALYYLLNKSGGRTDFRIASGFAQKELGYITDEQYKEALTDLSAKGEISLLPYSENDFSLAAMVCVASPELVNKGALTKAFYDRLNMEDILTEELTYCYLGLAALSEPVLTDISRLLEERIEQLSYYDQLRLCAALALLGDERGALERYIPLTADIKIYADDKKEVKAYIKGERDTSFALLTASVLNLPEAEGFVRYLIDSKSKTQVFVLDIMSYLRRYTPKVEGNATFSYRLNGKTETVNINRFSGVTLNFGREQLAEANFKVISGDVGCKAYYIGTLDELETESKPSLNITKTYSSETGGWEAGSLIKVTLSVSGGDSVYYMIDDIVPSGARYAGYGYDSQNSYYSRGFYVERSEQRISAVIYKAYSAVYYIRLVTAGEYVDESAVVRDISGNWGKSERGTFTVIE